MSENLLKNKRNIFNNIKKSELLPLITAAAVLRNYEALQKLISVAKEKGISFKKMYEALLQNYLFAGFPSAILSLKKLRENYPTNKLNKAEDMNLYHFRKQGIQNCKMVYGTKYEKLINNIKDFSPDLADWLVFEGYGKVLSRKGLSFKERELCIVSVLSALKFEDQLFSHINGAYRAKATIEEIKKVIENLNLLGSEKSSKFGVAVLSQFKKDKGMS